MVIWSGDGTTRSTARPGGINGRMRFAKEVQSLQPALKMGTWPQGRHRSTQSAEEPDFERKRAFFACPLQAFGPWRCSHPGLAGILRRLLEHSPQARFGSMAEVSERLRAVIHGATVPDPEPPLRGMFVGVLVVQAMVLLALWTLGRYFAV